MNTLNVYDFCVSVVEAENLILPGKVKTVFQTVYLELQTLDNKLRES